MRSITEHDLFYLRSILRNLDELREISMNMGMVEAGAYGVADDALEDNRDWLDCFIGELEAIVAASEDARQEERSRICQLIIDISRETAPEDDAHALCFELVEAIGVSESPDSETLGTQGKA